MVHVVGGFSEEHEASDEAPEPWVPVRSVGEVSREEKMLYSGTDPESYITKYTLVYEYLITKV